MGAVYICECEHPKSQHKRERDGCRAVDCGCGQFEADLKASAAAQGAQLATGGVVTGPVRLPSSGCVIDPVEEVVPFTVPVSEPGLSTSARLAKAEQRLIETGGERDRAVEAARVADRSRDIAAQACADMRADFAKLEGAHALACTSRERNKERADLAEAELVSARQEIEQLREGRDQAVDRALELAKELTEVRSAADEKVRAVLAAEPPADVIDRQVRHLCETCGARYGKPYTDHEHGPLTAVTVTIARQGAPTA